MPHRRKAKKEFSPQLQFEPENSFLYLSYHGEDENTLSVSVDTFVIIFAVKFCDIKNIKFRQEFSLNKRVTFSCFFTDFWSRQKRPATYLLISRETSFSYNMNCWRPRIKYQVSFLLVNYQLGIFLIREHVSQASAQWYVMPSEWVTSVKILTFVILCWGFNRFHKLALVISFGCVCCRVVCQHHKKFPLGPSFVK